MHQVTAATIEQVRNQLSVMGPGPALVHMGTLEPVLHEHVLQSVEELLNEVLVVLRQRPELQMRLLRLAVLIVVPVLRTLHPPDQLGEQRAEEYRARLDALNAEARSRVKGH
jgi:hypothetical protein